MNKGQRTINKLAKYKKKKIFTLVIQENANKRIKKYNIEDF